jgi:hypothetical protein
MRKPSSKKGFVEKTSERLAWPAFDGLQKAGCNFRAKKTGRKNLGPGV